MIKSIRLQNFFGFQDCTVNLEPGANVLIGINGSGKSNFFKALQLLKESIAGIGTSKLINDTWGGSPKVKFLGSNKVLDTFSLSYVFSEPSNYLEHNADALTYEMLFKINPISLNYHLQEYIAAKVENAEKRIFERDINSTNEYSWEGNKIAWMNDTAPDTSFFHDYTDNLEAIHFIPLRQKIKQIEIYSNFDTSLLSKMRQPAFPTTQSALYPDGTNLSQVLNTMKISNRNAFKQIEEAIIEINRHYSGISFNHLANNIELLIEEEPFDHAVHISNISDGTLRFLCLMAILYNPNRGSVVCIDEPELGLHPDMILTLFEAIKYASKTSQIIISTHSAQLLDCFDLNQVIVFEKNKENATVVKQGMKEEDFSAWKDDYFVGKMWRSGAIGGNRW